MKLGLGLYRRMLDAENYAFARQAGAIGHRRVVRMRSQKLQMTCAAPWHAGMAHAASFIWATPQSIDIE
jgi:hypothetical protein